MTIHHRVATPADLERLYPLLDQEFIFGKGRKISIAQRFPTAFCAANAANIFVAEEDGTLLSTFTAKRFEWLHGGKSGKSGTIWRGAMIGSVWSEPQRRGQGIGGNLLKWGVQTLQDRGVQFAVLWTGRPEFYARLGWTAADVGMFGSRAASNGTSVPAMPDAIAVVPLALSNEREIDAIRQEYTDAFVLRQLLDYHQVPIPAENMEVLHWMEDGEPLAYALLGSVDDSGILYEMAGSQHGFPDLWAAMLHRYPRLMVNDRAGSPSQRWLAQHTDIAWENKKLAMWLPLSQEIDAVQMSQWYISYFDRI